jgi:PmbA protein
MIDELLSVASDVVARAMKRGATSADALAVEGGSTEVSINEGKVEKLERSESRDIGLRVFSGQSSAFISGSVFSSGALETMVERALAMAKLAPPDPHSGLAARELLAVRIQDLDLTSGETFAANALQSMAEDVEAVALGVPGVTKSAGATAYTSNGSFGLVTSNGFAKGYSRNSVGVSVGVIAGESTSMERDYYGHSAIYHADLEPIEKIGMTAGERAVKRLNPRKLDSQAVPILFDWRVATSLVGHLLGAINGAAIARGTSFLKDDLGKQLFQTTVNILDDPHRLRGQGSRPFDGEGLPTERRYIIEHGVLPMWLLDLRSARKLGLRPTGQASRGLASPPSPSTSNIVMEAGKVTRASLIKAMRRGLIVNEFIGSTINPVTGDYSRGASGFWVENGEIAYPVSGLTIAGNLKDMFKSAVPANDLIIRSSSSAPSILIEGMTIAGK